VVVGLMPSRHGRRHVDWRISNATGNWEEVFLLFILFIARLVTTIQTVAFDLRGTIYIKVYPCELLILRVRLVGTRILVKTFRIQIFSISILNNKSESLYKMSGW
jgi:hypothetical protein